MTDHRAYLPQNQKGYKHKTHRYNYEQEQGGGPKFKRFCKRGHDKLLPYGIAPGDECRVCREGRNKKTNENRRKNH